MEKLIEINNIDNTKLVDKTYSKFYISVKTKFFINIVLSTILTLVAFSLSFPWIKDLSIILSPFASVFIISGIALIPGFVNAFLIVSLLSDKQPQIKDPTIVNDNITLLISAYNEEASIFSTLKYVKDQVYNGNIYTIVIDNNSNDNTSNEVLMAKKELDMDILLLKESKPGKFNALNYGLKFVETEYVITLDADTLIPKHSIGYLVSRIKVSPKEVCAVAGSMLVRNSRDNWLSKVQEWDYFLSIASIKRMQGLYQGTLVAQGAFSLYKTEVVSNLGGWSDAIGEDIVLTWKMLAENRKVYFEPMAIAFTDVPTKLSHFAKQRSRWARGMIEGLREVKPWEQPSIFCKFSTGIDLIIPYMDFSYTFFWIPGLFLALFLGNFAIVGPMMLLVFPLTLISFSILYYYQYKIIFKNLNLKVRRNIFGFVLFILFYQMIMSPVSLYGYMQEIFGAKRVWK
ncbi:glycosyltransferase family 2 protein [Paraclostridium sordellii]|uniref:glycosyltransferase family 2 protein n=1 Tax=Paraclostridium sordellii TaxID=1505 RepID=UPI0005EA16DF|nr:glycosyltransferase [Paeniclostridium sordellii]CEQ17464.1 glycosyl transferase family protein [[Clostridium] sordellii] [Paeniclostridium sordellii]